ncbi:hypothetical protein CCHR01_08718 [Colletotrichum chrysophilum]|uniref:Uncharacterized protein n=1 Tax=Colletotrichum chrysophilum TaxID=1836956 RepID=A0AAD9EHH6_9PEZI|nr:hypothetical protein CCHR01_08718 [Colletotrichum chrysophilum]
MRSLIGNKKQRQARRRVCRCLAHPSFDWEREILFISTENKSFIETKYDGTTTLIKTFLESQQYSPRIYYELPIFETICSDDMLTKLYTGRIPTSGSRVAWIDERNQSRGPRNGNGPVTIAELYRKLTSKPSSHVPDPGSRTLAALILSASTIVAPALRDFILRHFTAQRRFRAAFTDGPFAFTLEFHVPFFALRRHSQVPRDSRNRPDGSPCRRSIELSFLTGSVSSTDSNPISYWLHEVQTSLLVVGNNNTVWTAYLFTDTYHDGSSAKTNHDDLSSYQQRSNEDELFYDPITMGHHDASIPIWDPREYFCLIVRIRLGLIKEEWAYILVFLMGKIGFFELGIPSFLEPTGLGSAEAQARAIENAYDWITKAARLLQSLTGNLARVIQTWSSFAKDNIGELLEGSSNQLKLSMQKISASMDELREILSDMNGLMQKAEKFIEQLGLYVPVAGNRAIGLHHWTFNIVLLMSSGGLSSGIMQSEVICFEPRILCFFVLSIIIGLAMFTVKPLSIYFYLLCQPNRLEQETHRHQDASDMALMGAPWSNDFIAPSHPTFQRSRRRTDT